MINKICTVCKKEYEGYPQQKTCSDDCRKIRRKEYFRSWYNTNKKKQQKWMAEYYVKNKEHIIKINRIYDEANRPEVLRKGRANWHRYYAKNREKVLRNHRERDKLKRRDKNVK